MSYTTLIFALFFLPFCGFFGVLGFIAYASKQSRDNPLRVVMGALASRFLVTIGVGLIDIPVTTLQPIGSVVDLASLGLLAWYWVTGLCQMVNSLDMPSPPTTLPHQP